MAALSISRAWDETKAITEREGRLLAAVTLALIALPGTVSGLVSPRGFSDPAAPSWAHAVTAVATIIEVAGQLALIRLAIGPSISVGESIAHGLRRLPVYILAAVLITIGLFILCVPIALILMAAGVPLESDAIKHSPMAALLFLIYFMVVIFFAMRLLMTSSVATAEAAGPVAIIRRSWELTAGHWWRLFGFIAVFFIGAGVLVFAVGGAAGAIVAMLLGPPDPLSASALIIALVVSAINAVVTALLAVMLARIYVQLSGQSSVASVPKSGT
jgi:hypothetical protein